MQSLELPSIPVKKKTLKFTWCYAVNPLLRFCTLTNQTCIWDRCLDYRFVTKSYISLLMLLPLSRFPWRLTLCSVFSHYPTMSSPEPQTSAHLLPLKYLLTNSSNTWSFKSLLPKVPLHVMAYSFAFSRKVCTCTGTWTMYTKHVQYVESNLMLRILYCIT